jgi:polyphenol oxidase
MKRDLPGLVAARNLDWIVPAWSGPDRVQAVFTTRRGGAATGIASTFDLGPAQPPAGAEGKAIAENRRRLRELLPADPTWLHQVHGSDVVTITTALSPPPVADAAVTRAAAAVLAVRTADCLPLLLSDRAGSVLAVAHAGWRGLAGGVVENTLAAMRVPPADITAWIGPAIGPNAFEVGPDVVAAHCDNDGAAAAHFRPAREGKWMADLPGLARARLARAGVVDVAGGEWCTHTDAARFFSYRRDQGSGRMALVAWLAP